MAAAIDLVASSSTVTLRKRKHRDSLVIHLSSPSPSCENDPEHAESEYDTGQASDTGAVTHGYSASSAKKRYACTYEGCTRAYAKPSRLAEHERSHTGDVRLFAPDRLSQGSFDHVVYSDRTCAQHATNLTCEKLISKLMPARTCQALPNHTPARSQDAGSGSGPRNISAPMLNCTEERSLSRCVRSVVSRLSALSRS